MDSKHLRARVGGGVVGYSGDTSAPEGMGECRNLLLSETMRELNWSSSKLAAAVNSILGEGFIGRSTVSEWLTRSRVPREPLPTVVAHVLSNACGRRIDEAQLWPGWRSKTPQWVPADAGLESPLSIKSTVALADDWLLNGGEVTDSDRRRFMAVSGTSVTAPAWEYIDSLDYRPSASDIRSALSSTERSAIKITPPMVSWLESTIAGFRRLDDQEGGAAHNLRLVYREFRKVAALVKDANVVDPASGARLLAAFASLSQLAGWLAFDAENQGLAQRYFRTGLEAAHSCGDRNLGAHILACMSYQTSYSGRLHDSIELANAAMEAASDAHPAVRSSVAVRFALAQAVAGNLYGFRSAIDQARSAWSEVAQAGNPPDFLYWFGEEYIDFQFGEGLQMFSFASSRDSPRILEQADQLLYRKVGPENQDMPRDALLHGAWLARSHVRAGTIERALDIVSTAPRRLKTVHSPLAVSVLKKLDRDLAEHRQARGMKRVQEFRRELQVALAG